MNTMHAKDHAAASIPHEIPTSFLSRLQGRGAASHCHAVRYRLHGRRLADEMRRNFATLMTQLSGQQGREKFAGAELWFESVPGEADGRIGALRRNAEMRRSVDNGPGWRVVVLEYQGGLADMIVVAQRTFLDSASLQLIAGAIISGAGRLHWSSQGPLPGISGAQGEHAERLALLRSADYPPQLEWCPGNALDEVQGGSVQVDIGSNASLDAAVLVIATGVMAARYGHLRTPVIATVARYPEREPGAVGAREGLTLIPVSCGEKARACEEIASAQRELADPISWHTQELADILAKEREGGARISIGAFTATLADESPDTPIPDEYLPFLTQPYPLTMTLSPQPGGSASLQCSYRGSIDKAVLEQFTASVARTYLALLKQSDLDMAEIHALSPTETARVAAMGQSRDFPPAWRDRIDRTFEEVARQSPSAPALVFGTERLSYRELDEYANRVRRVLREFGVEDGHRVGVCVERSLELIVVLLGVMKAGATYVPMDPAYPPDRLAFITQDADVKVVVTSNSDFPAGDQLQVLPLPQLATLAAAQPNGPIQSTASCEDPAYIIYTSGSTGRPKGVAIPHHNVLSLIAATRKDFELSASDTWTFFHSSAFDFSVWEIWGCLLTGGCLVVVPYWVSRSPSEFLELLGTERVTVLNQTPSAFSQLIEAERAQPMDLALRLVIFGGEPLNTRMLLPWFDRRPETQCRLVNMFGITETTVHVTAETISRNDALKGSRSVGRPLPGWHIYVTDPAGRVLPPGVPGEICVGGAGVALKYVNRPDLTAERFVQDPYAPGRMYRSGDKGRLLPDGRLEHLGRLDNQVKIRGFRIELSEIEAVLLDAPNVTAAAVVLHQDDPSDPASARLNAYVVMESGRLDEVRQYISRVLPEYMMPASLTVLPSLPLTGNGKLDVKRLPRPTVKVESRVDGRSPAQEPADNLAHVVQEIWQKILKVPLGLDDNFFDLGGNSLYAVRIAADMRKKGLPHIPLRELYVHQTIRRIAASLHAQSR